MKLTVEVISKEVIKPSSPTPHHLKTFKLSFLDQSIPPSYVPIILFYSANDENKVQKQTDHLKKSLSEILTHFYPLGGRISDNYSIDCNDEGIDFFESRVSGDLSFVLKHPVPEELDQLLPRPGNFYVLGPKALLSIQVNIFDCGGIALGVCISHKAGDAASFSLFLKNWASLGKGDNQTPKLKLDLMTSLFPPKSDMQSSAFPNEGLIQKKFVTKRFVFDDSNLASLRARCSNNLYVDHPTRVEAVCALIWRSAIGITDSKKSASMAMVAMNLRRMVPLLSDLAFGNALTRALTTSTFENSRDLHCLVAQLRKAIRKVESEYVEAFQIDRFLAALRSSYEASYEAYGPYIKGEAELYIFTSWCRMSFYETDFGWGKPVWASYASLPPRNSILFMDTKCGKGVEAWVSLNEEDMSRFECDPDLVSFTSTN